MMTALATWIKNDDCTRYLDQGTTHALLILGIGSLVRAACGDEILLEALPSAQQLSVGVTWTGPSHVKIR